MRRLEGRDLFAARGRGCRALSSHIARVNGLVSL